MMMKSGDKRIEYSKFRQNIGKSDMKTAINEALKCKTDVPVGCVIKKDGEIVAAAHNKREEENDVTAHAEMLAIRDAQKRLGTSRLTDCEMYVTLEPCPMCSWAIIQSRIKTVYFGSYNPDYGALISNPLPHVNLKVYGGIDEEICDKILEEFFKKIR